MKKRRALKFFHVPFSIFNFQFALARLSRMMESVEIDQTAANETIARLRQEVSRVVVGQSAAVDRLVIALLVRGHVLVEGLPGLAKTLLVKTLASAIAGTFKRVQFTPDLLPADITGTL